MAKQGATTGNGEEVVHFKDAIGRKFVFPFELVNTWHGVAQLVKSAFVKVDVLGPHVQEEHFDLVGPDGDIILPLTWASRIRPGMAISMMMWPLEGFKGAPPQPPFMPGVRPGPPPSGGSKQPPIPVPHPPGAAAGPAGYPEHIVPGGSAKPKARKTAAPTLVQLMTGKPIKKNKGSTRFGSQNLPPPPIPSQRPAPTEKADDEEWRSWQPPPGIPPGSSHPPGFERVPGRPPPTSGVNIKIATPPKRRRPSLSGSSSGSSSSSSSTSYSKHSHDSVDSRPSARSAGLVVHRRRNPDERRVATRQITVPILEPSPTKAEIIQLSPARVYPDEIGTSPGLALELTRLSSPPGPAASPGQGEKITWAHVSRSVMDLAEFENIALNSGVLRTNPDSRLALEGVFRTLNDKKLMRSRDNWFIQPGTVLRCDVDSGSKTVASATFASVPQLQPDPLSRNMNVKLRKGVCLPRRLHEAFDPYDTSFERDKNQVFRKGDGAKDDAILWVCETWILIVDSTDIITYGDPRRRLQLQGTIDIREPVGVSDEKVVHVTTPEHVQFQIPMHDCETFFKLQSSIHEQLKAVEDRFDLEFNDFDIFTGRDEPLTAKMWSELVKATRESSVHVKIGWLYDSSSSASHADSRTSSSRSSRRSSSILVDDIVEIVEEPEFFSMKKVAEKASEHESFAPPELHPKVPPFLGWSILESTASSQDLQASQSEGLRHDDLVGSIRACLIRTETGLVEGHHPHVAALKEKFAGLDFKPGIMQFGVENIDMHIQTFGSSKRHRNREQSDQDDRDLHLLCRVYLLVCVRALEAFAPKTHNSAVLSLYFDALSKTAQNVQTQPALAESSKWVLSRGPPSSKGYTFSNEPSLPQIECHGCEQGTIYTSADDALEHLRKKHHAEMLSESHLRTYLIPLSEAARTTLKEEATNILAVCRDMMVDIIKQAREIQEGVVSDDRFRKPAQGVPYALLKTFQLLVAQVCAVPILLAGIQSFYTHEIYEEGVKATSLPAALSDKWRLLKSTDAKISTLMRTAERALIAPAESRKKEDVVKFFNTIGAHGLALQMISNVLQEPTYNNSNAAVLYRNYMTNLGSQVIRRSTKRHIPTIAALADELGRLADVIKSQQKLIQDLRTVFKPDTHLEPLKTDREKTFGIEQFIIDDCRDKLQEQIDMIGSSIERGDQLISMVHEFTEIMKDDHSRAIFVFTVVTVVFLPLSFVAAYLSMNGGPSDADSWGDTQRLFWKIAAPLAIGIGAFCLVVAWPRPELQVVKIWVIGHATRLKARFSLNPGPAESSTSPASGEMK